MWLNYTNQVCVPTPNSYVEILTLKVMVIRGGAFGKWLGHEGRALINGLVPLYNKPLRAFSAFTHFRTQWESTIYESGSRSSPDTESAGALILDFLDCRIVISTISVDYKPLSLWHSVITAWRTKCLTHCLAHSGHSHNSSQFAFL